MENQLLLLEDVNRLGRKGDIVKTKPGFARNYLLPQKKAVIATAHTLRMRSKLQVEREKQASVDRKEAESLVVAIEGKVLAVEVKVDPAGHMYGSVSSQDIVKLFEAEGVTLDRQYVVLVHPIKEIGQHKIELRFKEGITTSFVLNIFPEGGIKELLKEEKPSQIEEEIPE